MVDSEKKNSPPKSEVKTDGGGSKPNKKNVNHKEAEKKSTKKYSREEGQKPVNKNYRRNWEKIFQVKGKV